MYSFRTKKTTSLLVMALVILTAVSACGQSTNPPDSTNPSGPDTTAAPTLQPASTIALPITPTRVVTPKPTPMQTAVPSGANKVGVHLLLTDGSRPWPEDVWDAHMSYASQAVGEWGYVVQLITASDLKPLRWQHFMQLCAQYHLTPVIRLATSFNIAANYWEMPAQDPDGSYKTIAATYADFLKKLHWPTDRHYIVIGNEPNHGNEWANKPNPAQYARYLVDMADAIHAADPAAQVMNGGFDSYSPNTNGLPAPDGFIYYDEETFMDDMVAAQPDVFKHIDLWASHPYPRGPFISGPWDQVYQIDMINGATNPHHADPPPDTPNRGVNSYNWELWKLSTYGITDLKVMITESGWRHSDTADDSSLDLVPDLTDAKSLALYVHYAYVGNDFNKTTDPTDGWTPWLTDPHVVAACLFALDGRIDAWGHTNLLELRRNGDVIDSYAMFDALQQISGGQ